MTRILSWNIQNGKGQDGSISLQRIADVIASMGTADVICVQEISRGLELGDDSNTPDQVEELSALLPGYEALFGVAIDSVSRQTSKRWQYGNAIFTKLPVLSVSSYPLPRPGVENIRHMTRQTSEIVVTDASGPLRIVNLHLEFHSKVHRLAQIGFLRDLQREALEQQKFPPKSDLVGPYQPIARPVDAVFCGDFNMLSGSQEYNSLLSPLPLDEQPFYDAWKLVHPDIVHDPTCGIYDHNQWPQGPHCRDFFFLSGNCASAANNMWVDTKTDASDHQPMVLEIGER